MFSPTAATRAEAHSEVVPTDDVRNIARGGGMLLIASAFGCGLNYLFGMYLARQLGPDGFGLYSLGLAVFQVMSLIAVLGLDAGTVKFISEQIQLARCDAARRTIRYAVCIAVASGLATGFLLAGVAEPLSLALYREPELAPVVRFFGGALPFAVVASVLYAALQALQRFGFLAVLRYGWEPGGKWVLGSAFLGLGWGLSGVLIAVGVTLAVSVVSAAVVVAGSLKPAQEPGTAPHGELLRLGAFCLPLAAATMMTAVAPRTDMLLLGFWKSAQEVGVYAAAFQTAAILALVLGAFETAFAPVIGRALVRPTQMGLTQAFQSVSRLTWLVTVPIAVWIMVFSEEILAMFGPAYVSGAAPLVVLTLGHLVYGAAGSANVVLLMGGHSRLVLVNTIALSLSSVVASALLIPRWGLLGGAVAVAGTLILTAALRAMQVWRLFHIHPFSGGLAKQLAAGVVMGLGLVAIRPWVDPVYSPALAGIGGCLFLAVLGVLGVDPSDKTALRALLKRESLGWM